LGNYQWLRKGEQRDSLWVWLWQRSTLTKATYAIDPAVEINLYRHVDMQSGGEILFTASFPH
jgi:hypothetical protein